MTSREKDMTAEKRTSYLTPQQYFKKIEDQKRTIERLLSENARLRYSLNKYKAQEVQEVTSTIDVVRVVINKHFNIDINFKIQKSEYVDGRRMYYHWLKNNTSMSLDSIANTLDLNQDHSTVIHALQMHEDLIETDKYYKEQFKEVMCKISTELDNFKNI